MSLGSLRLFAFLSVLSTFVSCKCGTMPPTMMALKDEREPCDHDEECRTGLCEAVPGFQTVCMRKCTETCHSDEVCEQLTPGRFSCNPDRGGLCQVCAVDSDCPYPGDKCLVVDGDNVCGRDCAYDQNCPTSYRCLNGLGADGHPKSQQCSPVSGSCSCTAASAGQMISCNSANGIGTCIGTQTCDGVMGYLACTARVPANESCNGIDDNCNGVTDEGLPAVTCGVGACQHTIPLCGDGGVLTCEPLLPGVETCNQIDDDCDGVTDDGFDLQSDIGNCGACGRTCAFPNSTPRCASGFCEVLTCNPGYGNCNGTFADGCEVNVKTDVNNCGLCSKVCEAANADSTCTNGTCNFTCQPGFYDLDHNRANGCEYACTFATAFETCNMRDDDCNGVTDDGFDLKVDVANCGICGRACAFPNSIDRCVSGLCEILTCNMGYENCNGTFADGCEVHTVDDVNHCGSCSKVCSAAHARSQCSGGSCGFTCLSNFYDLDHDAANGCEYACTFRSATETCNHLDDDCDGTTDNGFNLQTDLNNCGTCGKQCQFTNATPACNSGICEIASCVTNTLNCDGQTANGCEVNKLTDVNNCGSCNHVCPTLGSNASCTGGLCHFSCKPNFYDLDGDPANGCEYGCTFSSATDLPDVNMTDANCDGLDGEVNNGIFVSPSGNDSNAGTMASPKATIRAAALAAGTAGKRDVYVALGTYGGPLDLSGITGKNIAGGYSSGATRWTRSSLNTTTLQGGNPALLLSGSDNTMVQFFTVRGDNATGTDVNGHGNSAYAAQVKTTANAKLELLTLYAGNGVAGVDGANGSAGTPGGNGGPGIHGCVEDGSSLCDNCPSPSVGTGGTSACGRPGGAGGSPGRTYSGWGSGGSVGQIGIAAGAGTPPNDDSGDAYWQVWPSSIGANGSSGTAGSNGSATPALGALTVAGYLPPLGGAATAGIPGMGGGGGGGGGGGCTARTILGVEICYCFTYGSSGGGGGGGGCGGNAGTQGKSGGASIALMLWNSTVTQQQLTVIPGRGGNGGKGGTGGTAGSGGAGASSSHDWGSQGYSQIGGKGGNGGTGGVGGHGPGGAGGPAIGILRNAASSNLVGFGYTPGTGGTGGMSSGNGGPNGTVVNSQQL